MSAALYQSGFYGGQTDGNYFSLKTYDISFCQKAPRCYGIESSRVGTLILQIRPYLQEISVSCVFFQLYKKLQISYKVWQLSLSMGQRCTSLFLDSTMLTCFLAIFSRFTFVVYVEGY